MAWHMAVIHNMAAPIDDNKSVAVLHPKTSNSFSINENRWEYCYKRLTP